MSVSAESDFLDALDQWLVFKKDEAKGIGGTYVGWVYGHQEFNEEHAKDRAEIASQLAVSLRALFAEKASAQK